MTPGVGPTPEALASREDKACNVYAYGCNMHLSLLRTLCSSVIAACLPAWLIVSVCSVSHANKFCKADSGCKGFQVLKQPVLLCVCVRACMSDALSLMRASQAPPCARTEDERCCIGPQSMHWCV